MAAKLNFVIVFSFCFILGANANRLFVPLEVGSWIEGQRLCAEKGGRLLNTNDFSFYLEETLKNFEPGRNFWIGDVQRVSELIHIEGCYDRSSIQAMLSSSILFTSALTPARCQEVCWNEYNSSYFAIKQEECYCLQGLKDITSLNLTSVAKCDYKCNTKEPPRACGSKDGGDVDALSVYKSSMVPGGSINYRCIKIECSFNKKYMNESCSETLKPFCSQNVSMVASNWNISYDQCNKGNGYLDGRANLKDVMSKCGEIHERFPNDYVFWLGIRRQSFQTMDQGYSIRPDSLEKCEYFNTSLGLGQTDLNCSTARYSVCLLPNGMERNSKTNLPDSTNEDPNGQNHTAVIVGGVVGGVLASAAVFIVLLLYARWKRNRHKEDRATSEVTNSLSKVHDENVQVESSVDKYSVVKGKGTEEDMYYESQNEYDILGKKRSKTKVQEDNFYNMSENPVNQNVYARADQVSKRVSDTEDMYDHTNGSDMYGVSLVIESENVYNQSKI